MLSEAMQLYIDLVSIQWGAELSQLERLAEGRVFFEKVKTDEWKSHLESHVGAAHAREKTRIEQCLLQAGLTINLESLRCQTESIHQQTKVELVLMDAEYKIFQQEIKNAEAEEKRKKIQEYNQKVTNELPRIQKDFMDQYTKILQEKNGQVKNITDCIELPYLEPDAEGILKLVEGRLK